MADFNELMSRLSPRKALFVEKYLVSGSGAEAARLAGYSSNENSAKSRAWHLLNKDEDVVAAVAAAHVNVAERAMYTAEAAMGELRDAMDFAKSTNNATALARCIELRSKISGILIDRAEIKTAVLSIDQTLAEARGRTARYIEAKRHEDLTDDAPMVEVQQEPGDDAAAIEDIFK